MIEARFQINVVWPGLHQGKSPAFLSVLQTTCLKFNSWKERKGQARDPYPFMLVAWIGIT